MAQFVIIGWTTWGDCEQPTVSRRMLRFADGTQTAVVGLNEILADIYAEGRQANQETAEEIIDRLEKNNYIPSSHLIRKEYIYVLLKEYREYIEGRDKNSPKPAPVTG